MNPRIAALLLAAVVLGLYAPLLGAGFVYDARAQVLVDTFIHEPHHLRDVLTLRVLGQDVLDGNRPLNLLTLMADAALWGRNPAGYHLTNIFLHLTATLLLFRFLLRTTSEPSAPCRRGAGAAREPRPATPLQGPWPAFAAALLFAVHPVNLEPVAEISSREDILATIFTLAALNLTVTFRHARTARSAATTAAIVACCFLAVAAKETGAAAPPILAAYWWLFRRHDSRRGWPLLLAAASIATAAFVIARLALAPESAIFTTPPTRLDAATWLSLQPRIFAAYLEHIVFPHNLSACYGPAAVQRIPLPPAIALLGALIATQFLLARRDPRAALGTAIFWLALLPVSNLVPLYQPMADRYLYLPLTGVALLVACCWSASACPPKPWQRRLKRPLAVLGALLAAAALATTTWNRLPVWHNDVALWTHVTRQDPARAYGWGELADALLEDGRPTAALAALDRANTLRATPDARALALRAIALHRLDRPAEADAAFRAAAVLDPRYLTPDRLTKTLAWTPVALADLHTLAAHHTVNAPP